MTLHSEYDNLEKYARKKNRCETTNSCVLIYNLREQLGSIDSDTKTVQSESGNLGVKRKTDCRQSEDRFNRDRFGKPGAAQNALK